MSSGNILVVGIDPSLSATGLVALLASRRPGGPFLDVAVPQRLTVRPPRNGPLGQRLSALWGATYETLDTWLSLRFGVTDWWVVSENPMDYTAVPGQRYNSPENIGKLGAATGVVLEAAWDVLATIEGGADHLVELGTKAWLPKTRGKRGGSHFMAHDDVVKLLRRAYPVLAGTTDDETMAAGVALHHARRVLDKMAQRQGVAA